MLRCVSCDFVYAAERTVPDGIYDAAYSPDGEYAGLLASAKSQMNGTAPFDWMHAWVYDRTKPAGNRRSLDLGCGVGSAAYLAARAGWTSFGQDVSQNALRVAREVFGITTFSEEIGQIVARGERFELVTAFNLVEHIPDPIPYLRAVRALTADGGHFGIAVPNYDSYAMRNATWAQWLPPFHLNFFTTRTLDHALRAAGFRLEQRKVKFASWSGFPGTKVRRLALAPYLVANALIGRLRGNGIVALARAV